MSGRERPESVKHDVQIVRRSAYGRVREAIDRIHGPRDRLASINYVSKKKASVTEKRAIKKYRPGRGRPTVNFVNWVIEPVIERPRAT
jgi:hypothetical protein